MIERLALPHVRAAAMKALEACGEAVLPQIQAAFEYKEREHAVQIRLIRICGRIRGTGASAILRNALDVPDMQIQTEILQALVQCGYRAGRGETVALRKHLKAEIARAAWILAALIDLEPHKNMRLLTNALRLSLDRHRQRLFDWLSFLYDPQAIRQVKDSISQAETAGETQGENGRMPSKC